MWKFFSHKKQIYILIDLWVFAFPVSGYLCLATSICDIIFSWRRDAQNVTFGNTAILLWSEVTQNIGGVAWAATTYFHVNLSIAKWFVCVYGRSRTVPQGENRKCFVGMNLISEVEQILPQKHFRPSVLSIWHVCLSWSWLRLSFLPMVLNRSIFMGLLRKSGMLCTYILFLTSLFSMEKSYSDSLFSTHFV